MLTIKNSEVESVLVKAKGAYTRTMHNLSTAMSNEITRIFTTATVVNNIENVV